MHQVDPKIANDLPHAGQLVRQEGVAILRGVDTSEAGAGRLMSDLLGDSLRALPPPAKVFQGGEHDRHLLDTDNLDALPVHTDGFAYGDAYPDYLLLICVNASEEGGDNFLVDGHAVLESMKRDPDLNWVPEALAITIVDQTEDGMQTSLSPIVQRSPAGRLMVRRTLDELGNGPKPDKNSGDKNKDQSMIDAWTSSIDRAASHAPRFKLSAGDAVIIDNYRIFHGREGYSDMNRMLWRVWGWSNDALKIPEQPLHSDSRYARSEASG